MFVQFGLTFLNKAGFYSPYIAPFYKKIFFAVKFKDSLKNLWLCKHSSLFGRILSE